MTVVIFRDDDASYESWLRSHPEGWVVNARSRPAASYVQLHRARCGSISQLQHGHTTWTTGGYIKVCAASAHELESWCQASVGAGPARGCYCVAHGLSLAAEHRGQPAHPQAQRAPETPATEIEKDANGFAVVRTEAVVPFEPKSAGLVDARRRVRRALEGLVAQPGELLHGAIRATTSATDLDNALLYNIGGRSDLAARHGVVFERTPPDEPTAPVEYRYRLTTDPSWLFQRDDSTVAIAERVVLGRQPRGWWDIWAATHQSPLRVEEVALTEPLGLDVVLSCPRFRGSASPQLVKTVVDGITTALHAADPSDGDLPEVARRLSRMVPHEAETVGRWLRAAEGAALGPRARLICLRGKGVQCSPDDGRVSALRLQLDRTADAWSLDARVTTVEPVIGAFL
jgi:hypothetical protein